MAMKTTLIAGISLLAGIAIGCLVSLHAASRVLGSADLEALAARSVDNVAEAYEAQVQKTEIMGRLTSSFHTCVSENSRLHALLWKKRSCK